jgi:hypothetical protein
MYPIRVTVKAHLNGKNMEIWSGSQRNLFGKYGAQRSKSIEQITANLQALKKELE